MNPEFAKLKQELKVELTRNILPYWSSKMIDVDNDGFFGRITGNEELVADADKGAILNARILWTFSSAFRILNNSAYLHTAELAKRYLIDNFYDHAHGGVYWSLDQKGNPKDRKKQIYALGFAIYGLSEFARATDDKEALNYSIKLFEAIEEHSFDKEKNGYLEALTEDWHIMEDMRLSDKDENEKKTMNTHLHILEPYTNLYRVWKSPRLKERIENLIRIFVDKILDKETHHLNLFFDEDWKSNKSHISYGHDIEASWLIHEAALVIENRELLEEIEPIVIEIAKASQEGLMENGGLIYELNKHNHKADTEFHWWVQAENVVGNVNLYNHFGDDEALHRACKSWNFIKEHIVDKQNGEWFWSSYLDGERNRNDDKAGFWKCPYHNGRMCMEILER